VAWERIAVSFLVRVSRVADLVSSLMMIRFMSSEMSLQLRPMLMAVSWRSPVNTLRSAPPCLESGEGGSTRL
jgi:hypothetical protein